MGTVEQHIEVIKRAVAAVNDGTMAQVASDLIAPGFVRHDLSHALPGALGPGGVIDLIQVLRIAVPDLRLTIEDIFGAGDRVAMRLLVSGTHARDLLRVPPTGRQFAYSMVNLYRMEDGKVAETWQLTDVWGFMNQVGVVHGVG